MISQNKRLGMKLYIFIFRYRVKSDNVAENYFFDFRPIETGILTPKIEGVDFHFHRNSQISLKR